MKIFVSILILGCFITSCAGKPPVLEYTLAQVALKYAHKVNAVRKARREWSKAIYFYRKGKKKFTQRNYIAASRLFNESIIWAEKAENRSRLKMSQGEEI